MTEPIRRRTRGRRREPGAPPDPSGARAPRSALSTAGTLLLGALLVALPLWWGGVTEPAEWVALVAAPLALLLVARGAPRLSLAGLLLLAVVAFMALQLLPIVPAAGASPPGGGPPAWRSISLDPPASGRELAEAIAAWAAFSAAWVVGATRRRRDLLLAALGLSGLAVALAVLGRALLGLGPLLAPTAPFVNSNHLSGFENLCAFALLGLALRARGQARALWLMAFVLVGAIAFLSLSRGGIGAFFGGVALFALLSLRRERPAGEAPWRLRLALVAGVAAALGVVAYLALDRVVAEMETVRGPVDQSKLVLWAPAVEVIRDHPLLGIGKGAFETVFPAYKTDPDPVTFTHVENEWLQPLADLGLPAGLLLVGTLAGVWLAAALRRDLTLAEVGLLAGAGALAAHCLVDFSLEIPGVAIPFAAALGLAVRGARPVAVRPALLAAVTGLLLAAGVAGLALWHAHPTPRDAEAVARAPDDAAAEAAAREAGRWHPADYLPAATVGARLAGEGRCARAMPWLRRAMLRSPTAPEPHRDAARCLAAAGDAAFARREYRLAFTYGDGGALAEAARAWPSVEALLEVAPETGDGLLALGGLLAPARPADAARVYRRALDELLDARALLPLARAELAAGQAAEALALARRRERERPVDPEGWALAAEALSRLGEPSASAEELGRGLALLPGSPPLAAAAAWGALSAGHPLEARRLAEAIAARTPGEVATRALLVAAALAREGRLGEAIDRARSAAAALPQDPGPLSTVAAYCEQAGRYDDAIAALERASQLPGQSQAAWATRLAKLRAARDEARDRRMEEQLLGR